MSAPVREPDDNGSLNDRPLNHAPKRVRPAEHDEHLESPPPKVNTAPRPHTLEPPESPWKRKKQRGVFAGDVAIVELRTQRLAPDRVPEPPLLDSTARAFGRVTRIGGVIAVVATGTVGYLLRPAPQATPPSQLALTSDRPNLSAEQSVSAANRKASSLDSKPAAVRPTAGGLAPGAASDAARGVPNSATPLAAVPTASPTQFNRQDSRAPAPRQAVSRQPTVNAAEVASMMKNGAELMANGDIAAARLMFKRAAETGDGGASFALAETYDPLVPQENGYESRPHVGYCTGSKLVQEGQGSGLDPSPGTHCEAYTASRVNDQQFEHFAEAAIVWAIPAAWRNRLSSVGPRRSSERAGVSCFVRKCPALLGSVRP
jgi:hypothetical protein